MGIFFIKEYITHPILYTRTLHTLKHTYEYSHTCYLNIFHCKMKGKNDDDILHHDGGGDDHILRPRISLQKKRHIFTPVTTIKKIIMTTKYNDDNIFFQYKDFFLNSLFIFDILINVK